MTTSVEFEQIVNLPFLYVNGMLISNDATTPNTKLDVSAGQCRDSLDQADLNLGNYLGINPNASANVATVINMGVVGLNGIDTGAIGASKMYYIYVIGDPTGFRPTGLIMSLALPAVGPLMPFGYGLQRWVGCWASGGGSTLLKGLYTGVSGSKVFYYDATQASNITAGNSGTYAAAKLTNLVPLLPNIPVLIQTNWTANAAGDTFAMQPISGTGDLVNIIAPVAGATAHTISYNIVPSQVVTTDAEINYKVSAGTVAINVSGFYLSL